jgi:hypothetical protein
MPGPFLHVGATVACPHGAPTVIAPGNPRVLASGMPVATMADAFTIAGCPFQVPVPGGTKPQPCVRTQWTVPAARVLLSGSPALIVTSVGVDQSVEGIPQGPPVVTTTQPRAVAT